MLLFSRRKKKIKICTEHHALTPRHTLSKHTYTTHIRQEKSLDQHLHQNTSSFRNRMRQTEHFCLLFQINSSHRYTSPKLHIPLKTLSRRTDVSSDTTQAPHRNTNRTFPGCMSRTSTTPCPCSYLAPKSRHYEKSTGSCKAS